MPSQPLIAEESRKLEKLAASIAHEIRNPLTGISSTVQLLESKLPPGDHRRECTHIILDEIARLEGIVNRFLMLARPVKIIKTEVDLSELIRKTLYLEQAHGPEPSVRIDCEGVSSDLKIWADAESVKQVLLNLIGNAKNFVPEQGMIQICVTETPSHVNIAVLDNGPGIPEEHMEQIFEPFFSARHKGVGLGLAISLQIARDHGGALTAENRQEGGAKFVLSVPKQ